MRSREQTPGIDLGTVGLAELMESTIRVALFFCTDAEAEAVVRQLDGWSVFVAGEDHAPDAFDVAIFGAFASSRAAVLNGLAEKLTVPAILLLSSVDDEHLLGDRFAALSPAELPRLRFVIRRELKLHHAELALRDSERRYRELIDQAQEGVWVIDQAGRTTLANQRLADLLGHSIEALDGTSMFDFIDPEMRSSAVRDIHAARDGHDVRFRRADGTLFWAMLTASPLFDPNGRYSGTLALVTDITERKQIEETLRRSEEELRRSEARYRTLVEQANDVIFSVDAEGRITSLNAAFETVTGFVASEWIGRHFGELIAPESIDSAIENFSSILAGVPRMYSEYVVRTRDGFVTMEITAQALVIDGRVNGTIGIGRDVTRRKAAEAERERDKRLASLGQLAASVAHEFNNVLMSILPFAELLKRRMPDDERVDMATRHITQAVRRGRQISQEILRFARPVNPALGPISVRDWTADLAREAKALLGPRYELAVQTDDVEAWIDADRSLLDQVATNLIINARDAMPQGGEVTLSVRRDAAAREIEIGVTDRGAGIPEHLLDRIFDPLFTTKPAGNGLGLTIAYQAMVLQNGTLRVSSRVGSGSTFTMALRESAPPAPREEPPAMTRGKQKRVVLVEDDESVAAGLAALLTDEGFDVRVVTRGLDAPPVINEFEPDVVLLDVNLPDVNGIDLFERLVERWPTLPVIFSTGHADTRGLEESRVRHVPTIMKPYDMTELLAIMATLAPPRQRTAVEKRDRRMLTSR